LDKRNCYLLKYPFSALRRKRYFLSVALFRKDGSSEKESVKGPIVETFKKTRRVPFLATFLKLVHLKIKVSTRGSGRRDWASVIRTQGLSV